MIKRITDKSKFKPQKEVAPDTEMKIDAPIKEEDNESFEIEGHIEVGYCKRGKGLLCLAAFIVLILTAGYLVYKFASRS